MKSNVTKTIKQWDVASNLIDLVAIPVYICPVGQVTRVIKLNNRVRHFYGGKKFNRSASCNKGGGTSKRYFATKGR